VHEPGFDVEDINRVVCRSDWTSVLRNVFIYLTTRSFYLSEFSARLISRPASEDQHLKPKSEFVGVAHTFYPHAKQGLTCARKDFATETFPEWFDGVVMAKVEGLTPEERRIMRSKLQAAVGDTSVDLHDDMDEYDDDDGEEEEGEC
jgi:hypothetical protein